MPVSNESTAVELLNELEAKMKKTLADAASSAKEKDFVGAISNLNNLGLHYTATVSNANRTQNTDTDAMAKIKARTSELFKEYRRNVFSYAQEQLKINITVAEKKLKDAEKKVTIQSNHLKNTNNQLTDLKSKGLELQVNDANIKAKNHQIQLVIAKEAVSAAQEEIQLAKKAAEAYKDPDAQAKAVAEAKTVADTKAAAEAKTVADTKAAAEAKTVTDTKAAADAANLKQEILNTRKIALSEFHKLVSQLEEIVTSMNNIKWPKFVSTKAFNDRSQAYAVGMTLVDSLKSFSEGFVIYQDITCQNFKDMSNKSIDNAKKVLDKQPRFKELLLKIASVIASIVTGIVILPAIARYQTRNDATPSFYFFRPDPMEAGVKATEIKKVLANMG